MVESSGNGRVSVIFCGSKPGHNFGRTVAVSRSTVGKRGGISGDWRGPFRGAIAAGVSLGNLSLDRRTDHVVVAGSEGDFRVGGFSYVAQPGKSDSQGSFRDNRRS